MLLSLAIKDFLIIQSAHIEFNPSFCVITGETGAGKSLIFDALLFCFGAKSENNIRQNAQYCSVVAELDIKSNHLVSSILEEHLIEHDGVLIVKRQDHIAMRKKFFINDQLVTQKLVNQIFLEIFEIHAQHSTTSLLDKNKHIEILDKYANLDSQAKVLRQLYKDWQQVSKTIESNLTLQKQNEQEINYLEFIIDELKNADLRDGEEEELLNKRTNLQQVFSQQKNLHQALTLIEESDWTRPVIALSKILAKKDASLSDGAHLLDQILVNMQEFEDLINAKISDQDTQQELLNLDDRLFEIRGLARKHNVLPSHLSQFFAISTQRLQTLQSSIADEANLQLRQKELFEQYQKSCQSISEQRKIWAQMLEEKINQELSQLISKHASFKVDIQQMSFENGSASGIDQVRFVVRTNTGMPHMSIEQVASGGELSRIMLAIKAVMLDATFKSTIIFDEIDSGVGGAVAEHIGEKLKYLAKSSQIITITHQAQVASKAAQHLCVHKEQTQEQTFCVIRNLDNEQKALELARMLSGKNVTKNTMAVAREMLDG